VASAATSVAASSKAAPTIVETSTVARTTVETSGRAAMESTATRTYEAAWAGVEAQTTDPRCGNRTEIMSCGV
jgi:hypothetical protein